MDAGSGAHFSHWLQPARRKEVYSPIVPHLLIYFDKQHTSMKGRPVNDDEDDDLERAPWEDGAAAVRFVPVNTKQDS